MAQIIRKGIGNWLRNISVLQCFASVFECFVRFWSVWSQKGYNATEKLLKGASRMIKSMTCFLWKGQLRVPTTLALFLGWKCSLGVNLQIVSICHSLSWWAVSTDLWVLSPCISPKQSIAKHTKHQLLALGINCFGLHVCYQCTTC